MKIGPKGKSSIPKSSIFRLYASFREGHMFARSKKTISHWFEPWTDDEDDIPGHQRRRLRHWELCLSAFQLNFWGKFLPWTVRIIILDGGFRKIVIFHPDPWRHWFFGGEIASFGEGTHNLAGGFKGLICYFHPDLWGFMIQFAYDVHFFLNGLVESEQSATRCAISDGRSRTLCSSDGVAQLGTNPSVMSQ